MITVLVYESESEVLGRWGVLRMPSGRYRVVRKLGSTAADEPILEFRHSASGRLTTFMTLQGAKRCARTLIHQILQSQS